MTTGANTADEASEYLLRDMSGSGSSRPEDHMSAKPQVLFSSEGVDADGDGVIDEADYPASPDARTFGHRRRTSWTEELTPRAKLSLRQLLAGNSGSSSSSSRQRFLPLRIISNRRCYIPTVLLLILVIPSLLAVHQAPEGSTFGTHPWTQKVKETYGNAKESMWALGAELQKGEEGTFGIGTPGADGDRNPDAIWDDDEEDEPGGPPRPDHGRPPPGTDPDPVDEGPPISHLSPADSRLYAGVTDLLAYLPLNWPVEPWLDARKQTLEELEKLKVCLERGDCREGQKTVIVGGSFHFGNSQYGHVSGEDIWARSSVDAFTSLGYTILYGYKHLENLAFHRALGEFIPVILMEAAEIYECLRSGIPQALRPSDLVHIDDWDIIADEDELKRLSEYHELNLDLEKVDDEGQKVKWGWKWLDNGETGVMSPGCIKRKGFEDGLPIWKLFALHFWNTPDHALGAPWTLAPEDYAIMNKGDNHYLGYSLEKYCEVHEYVKPTDRKDRAFVYGKEEAYFEKGHTTWYNDNHTFSDIHASLGMDFVAAVGGSGSHLPDDGLTNIGKQDIAGFYKAIGESKVTIGIGRPYLSPTPYDSLCLGVPFINPILEFDSSEPLNHTRWYTQQDGLNDIGEPWVYHVRRDDLEGLEKAVKKARETPIERFIPPRMTIEATEQRHKLLVEGDWKDRAREVIKEARKHHAEMNVRKSYGVLRQAREPWRYS